MVKWGAVEENNRPFSADGSCRKGGALLLISTWGKKGMYSTGIQGNQQSACTVFKVDTLVENHGFHPDYFHEISKHIHFSTHALKQGESI
jgi:hypothetical protein